MTILTAADYADTGQWRLIIDIYKGGISARLENTLHSDVEGQLLFSVKWDEEKSETLRQIENAVYDNPRVLDDFSARINIFDSRTLFVPTEVLNESEDIEGEIYTYLYKAESPDVMIDTDGDLSALYSLAPGLRAFLNRTFPGARIRCNLMNEVTEERKRGAGKRMIVTVRDKEADFVLLADRELVSASTHCYRGDTDIIYHILNIIEAYGMCLKEVEVTFRGKPLSEGTLVQLREIEEKK